MDKLNQQSDIVVIVVSSELLTASPGEITAALSSCLAQSGLYKQPKN